MTELIHDAQEINKLAEAFQSVSEDVTITTEVPPSTSVDLPGGYLFVDGTVGKVAEVRELNGLDEEAVAKTSSVNQALNVILERGLVNIDGETLSKKDLDTLLVGDRDAILLAICAVTFGGDVTYTGVCPSCAVTQQVSIDLTKDIVTKVLDNPIEDRVVQVTLKAGEALITLPNMITNKKLTENESKSFAESVTDLLSGCLISIDGVPSLGRSTALQLGVSDREKIAGALYENAAGPRLAEVSKACEACDTEIFVPLSLASLFRLQ